MPRTKISPAEQKLKLQNQLKEIEGKIKEFDNQRSISVGNLAKRLRLIDLPDEILEKEFKAINDKYKKDSHIQNKTVSSKKNS